ncbi:hypothetical protein Ga0074115_1262 [endosymbiont of Ridgeia piscesae]|jgi:alpha-L-arabinofuranosidase|uniref:Alpha-L-arabinofuranosidase n=1 Tax=endosymbiont of Ridgeia piscesae TaxID=54398 RepID=A0A0T5YZB6_9GAMM|nr:hypothetical protein Ga0074115_1262 [endosymbiont of Ridgeia piscesae]KRT57151.1 hypothetical protein Ga0076813_11072 [endosymbiont of Ridgeia piscesae]
MAQEAADWVRYSNGENDWNIRYWEIGNKIYGDWEQSWTHDGTEYMAGDAGHDGGLGFCREMKTVAPSIQVAFTGQRGLTQEDGFAPRH